MVSAGWWLGTPPQQRQNLVAGRMLALPDGSWWLFGAWGRWFRWTPADGQWHLCPPPRLAIARMSARPLQQGMPVPPVPPHVVPTGPDLAYDPPAALAFVDAGVRPEVTSRVRATVESAAALPTPDYPHWWGLFSSTAPSTVAVTWGVMLWCATSPVFDSRIDAQLLGLWSSYRSRPLPEVDGPRWLTPPPLESLIGLYTERLRAGRVDSAVVVLRTMWAMASALREDVRFQPRADALISMLGVTLQNPTIDYGALSYGDQAVVQQWLTRCPPALAPALRVEASAGEHFRNAYYDLAVAVTPIAGDPSSRGYVEPRLIAAALLAADLAVVRQDVSSQVVGWLDPQVSEAMRAMLIQRDHPLRPFWPESDRMPRSLRERMDAAGPTVRNTLLATMYAADLAWCRLGGGIPARPRGFPSSVAILAEIIGPGRATSAAAVEPTSQAPGIAPLAHQYPSNPGRTPGVPLAQEPPTGPPGQAPSWAAPDATPPPSTQAWEGGQSLPGSGTPPGGSAARPPSTQAWDGAQPLPGTGGSPAPASRPPSTQAWDGAQLPPNTGDREIPRPPPATEAWQGSAEPTARPPATEAWSGSEGLDASRPSPPPTQAWSGTGERAAPPPATEAWSGSVEPAAGRPSSPPPSTQAVPSPPATVAWSADEAVDTGGPASPSATDEREARDGSGGGEISSPPATVAWSVDGGGPPSSPMTGEREAGASSVAGDVDVGDGERGGQALPLPAASQAPIEGPVDMPVAGHDVRAGVDRNAAVEDRTTLDASGAADADVHDATMLDAGAVAGGSVAGGGMADASIEEDVHEPTMLSVSAVEEDVHEPTMLNVSAVEEDVHEPTMLNVSAAEAELDDRTMLDAGTGGGVEAGGIAAEADDRTGEDDTVEDDDRTSEDRAGGEDDTSEDVSTEENAQPGHIGNVTMMDPLDSAAEINNTTYVDWIGGTRADVGPIPIVAPAPVTAEPPRTKAVEEQPKPAERPGTRILSGSDLMGMAPMPERPVEQIAPPPTSAPMPKVAERFGIRFLSGADDATELFDELHRNAPGRVPALLIVGEPHTGQRRLTRLIARTLAGAGLGDGSVRTADGGELRGDNAATVTAILRGGTTPAPLLFERLDRAVLDATDPARVVAAVTSTRDKKALIATCDPESYKLLANRYPQLTRMFKVFRLPDLSGVQARLALMHVLTDERRVTINASGLEIVRGDLARLAGHGDLVGARLVEAYLDRAVGRHTDRAGAPRDRLVLVPVDFAGVAEEIEPVLRPPRDVDGFLRGLDEMIGLDDVKRTVGGLVAEARMAADRAMRGLPSGNPSRHLIFLGRPGTGKATVAGLIGGIYAALNLLDTGQLVACSARDFAGDTAAKVAAYVERAIGGILLIEEAYLLDRMSVAVEELSRLMAERRDKFMVVCASPPDEMEGFLLANPGFRAEFGAIVEFRDPTDRQLVQLFSRLAERDLYMLDEELRVELLDRFGGMRRYPGFAFADTVRRLFDKIVGRQAARLAGAQVSAAAVARLSVGDLPESEGGRLLQELHPNRLRRSPE